MDFEWDERKRESNIVKHDIDFEAALDIWKGLTIEQPAFRDFGEPRFIAVGAAGDKILAVIYTWRGDVRRLISARRARRHERRAYHAAVAGLSRDGPDELGEGRLPH